MDAQTQKITRRRFLSVCAMAGVVSAMPWAEVVASTPLHRWNGILLGAEVNLTLAHSDEGQANRIFKKCVKEIKRLENIFTLYDIYSEISQLNKNGILRNPSDDMVDILEQSYIYHDITDGAFDVTVKPLEQGMSLDLVGMKKLHVSNKEIRFDKQEMSITLNGIAQGYITDRITELLEAEGLENVLVELGEKRAIAGHPSGRSWLLDVQAMHEPVLLFGKALATSASQNGDTAKPHIFMPSNGQYAKKHNVVSVLADNATMADALSTGFMSLEPSRIKNIQDHLTREIKVFIA